MTPAKFCQPVSKSLSSLPQHADKSKAAKLQLDNHCLREGFRKVPHSTIYIFLAREADLWADFILTHHAFDLEIRDTAYVTSQQMERQQCCLKRLKRDASWQLREHGQSTDPHIKDQRIRRDGEERSQAVVIAHLHTCTHQTNAKLNHQSCRFDRVLSWVWLLAGWTIHLCLSGSNQ